MSDKATAYLGLGSNLGDRLGNLRAALKMLTREGGCVVAAVSSIYQTQPVGLLEQPDFMNAVAQIETGQTPRQLLQTCLDIEASLGRVRTIRWGPRVIDIDILAYGACAGETQIIREDDLSIPHPRMMERAFVLVPLAEIAPGLVLGDGSTVSQAAERVNREGVKLLTDRSWFEAADEAL